MIRNILFAVLPLTMMASAGRADDSDLNISLDSITDADVEIVEASLDIDVDALSKDEGSENLDEAIEACFRRYRGHYRSWGYGYGYNWNSYRPYYQPCYRVFHSVRPIYHFQTVCAPIYNCYWGCY